MDVQDVPRMDYRLINAPGLETLRNECKELCAQGWIPTGSPTFWERTDHMRGCGFMQAFVRPLAQAWQDGAGDA